MNENYYLLNESWYEGCGRKLDGSPDFYEATRLISPIGRAESDLLVFANNPRVEFQVDILAGGSVVRDSGMICNQGFIVAKGSHFGVQLRYSDGKSLPSLCDEEIKNGFGIKIYEYSNVVDVWDTPIGAFSLTPYFCGLNIANQIRSSKVAITSCEEYGHQGMTVIKNGKVYVAYTANTETKKEYDENTFARLSVFELSNPGEVTNYTIASKGKYGDIILSGVTSLVSLTDNGDTLECHCYGFVDGEIVELHRTFEIATQTMRDLELCKLVINGETHDFTNTNIANLIGKDYGLLKIGAEMGTGCYAYYEGDWYTWVYTGAVEFNGILLKTRDFVHFEFVMSPAERTGCHCEIIPYICGDYMYTAFRRSYKDHRLLVVKYDMKTFEEIERVVFKDCANRPYFYEYDGQLYLMHATFERKYTSIVKLSTRRLMESTCVANIENLYLGAACPVISGDVLYVTFSAPTGDYSGIWFSHFNPNMPYTVEQVNEKLHALME